MIRWQYYPKSKFPLQHLVDVTGVFQKNLDTVDSNYNTLSSNQVLAALQRDLESLGWVVESGKRKEDLIEVPVLFGLNGQVGKTFHADALHVEKKTVLEVEAGRAVDNNEFLKDLFQACMMPNIDYLTIAVRNLYRGNDDFSKVMAFFDTMYASGRLQLPLKGILIVGY